MTEILLAFLPEYGLYTIASIVFIAALGIPMPSSIVVLTSGGLAATGDFVLLEVLLSIFFAHALGDQLTYTLGNLAKPELLDRFRTSKPLGSLVQRSESLYDKHDLLAVFISHTVISSVGPYIAYFCGAKKMKRSYFTATALAGSALWTLTYVMLGYLFAGNLPQISNLVVSFLLTGTAALLTLGFTAKLLFAWRRFEAA